MDIKRTTEIPTAKLSVNISITLAIMDKVDMIKSAIIMARLKPR